MNSLALTLFGFVMLGLSASAMAADQTPAEAAALNKTLATINGRLKNVDVKLIKWPDKLHQKLGKLKKIAFIASPVKKTTGKLPLVISLHGGGGKTWSLQRQLDKSSINKGLALAELANKDMILLEPNSFDVWDANSLNMMLDYVLANYPEIDKNRVYVMGYSMGGLGTWNWILQSADRFAAAAPCGFRHGAETGDVKRLLKLPIWGMAGGADGKRIPVGVKKMVERLKGAGNPNVKHTIFEGANHSEGNAAVFKSVELVDWMMRFKRSP